MLSRSSLRLFLTIGTLLFSLLLVGCGIDNPTTSYQGYLSDASGAPIADGTYAVTYRLYSSASGGTAIYTEAGSITVTSGLFSTSFGGADLPTEDLVSELWLEVEIEGEVLTPRQRLQGAPFAWTLVSGAVIGSSEPISRTIGGIENAGAGLIVANTLGTGGGSGILGITLSDSADAAGVSGASQAGSYGGRFSSQEYRGLRTDTENTSFYTAAFFGGIGIYVEGNCTGCRTVEIAQNVGGSAIAAGDFVAVENVTMSDTGAPILQVRRATAPSDVIIGVAVGATSGPVSATAAAPDKVAGDAGSGDYLMVGVTGLFPARLAADANVAVGDYLTAGTDGAALLANRSGSGNSPARVMSTPGADGMVWVMLGGQ